MDPGINGTHRYSADGTREVAKFDAPKATLMSYIIKGILNRELPWGLVLLGAMISLVLEMSGIASLAFAVGVYLPLSSTSPIFIGGLVRWLGDLHLKKKHRGRRLTEEQLAAEGDRSPGVLLASGYIAGGAIAGIVIAFMAGVLSDFTGRITTWAAANNPFYEGPNANLLSLVPFAGLVVLLLLVSREVLMAPGGDDGIRNWTPSLRVGDHFNPEVGFVRRDDMKRAFTFLRFSPRPASMPSIRRFIYAGSADYIENGQGWLETRELEGQFGLDFQNSDRFNATFTNSFEALDEPFEINPGVTLPVGAYEFDNIAVSYSPGQQHRVSGTFQLDLGTFYNGRKTSIAYTRGRVEMTPQLSLEPTFSANWVELEGSFTATLVGSRVTYTVTPLMFVSALVQYNASGSVASANARFRWEYQPGSELFVVFNEERDTESLTPIGTRNRSLIVKVNRLFRF